MGRPTLRLFTSWLLSRYGRLPYCSPVAQKDLGSFPHIYRALGRCDFLPSVALHLALGTSQQISHTLVGKEDEPAVLR